MFIIKNDADYEACLKIACPWIDIDYMSPEGRERYFNLTKEEREEIKRILENK